MNRLTSYTVNDCVPQGNGLRVVFLLESPYSSEVVHKHPLAGDSGRGVTKWLANNIADEFRNLDPRIPFGCHLKARRYLKIGLMNCSLLPMDESVYSCSIGPSDKKTIRGMDLIRDNPESNSRQNPKHAKIEQKIIKKLTSRLMKLPDSVLLVPCGKVARAMVIKSKVSEIKPTLRLYDQKVPHPSYNNWSADDNQAIMEAFRAVLHTRLCPRPTFRAR